MKMLSNAVVLRMALLLFAFVFCFVMGVVMIRRMRSSLWSDALPKSGSLPDHVTEAVERHAQDQRAKAAQNGM